MIKIREMTMEENLEHMADDLRSMSNYINKAVRPLLNTGGCIGCDFDNRADWEMPCVKCKRNCNDYYRTRIDE